jgi:hypothetical protein
MPGWGVTIAEVTQPLTAAGQIKAAQGRNRSESVVSQWLGIYNQVPRY